MADQRLLLGALSEFARTLVNRYGISDALFRLTDHITETLGLAGAGVSFADETGALRFATANSEALTEVERAQEALQQGPCLDAFRTQHVVQSADLDADERWPGLKPAIQRASFRSAAAIPLCSAGQCIGSLNLYDTDTRVWSDDDLQAGQLLGDMATSYVLNASELERAERTREQLQQALDSRVVIEQAKGMIASAHGVTVDEAFDRIRQYARRRNAKLRDVARAIVELGLDIR